MILTDGPCLASGSQPAIQPLASEVGFYKLRDTSTRRSQCHVADRFVWVSTTPESGQHGNLWLDSTAAWLQLATMGDSRTDPQPDSRL